MQDNCKSFSDDSYLIISKYLAQVRYPIKHFNVAVPLSVKFNFSRHLLYMKTHYHGCHGDLRVLLFRDLIETD